MSGIFGHECKFIANVVACVIRNNPEGQFPLRKINMGSDLRIGFQYQFTVPV